MKIEMGESLLYSWLRHAKECQIVQTNWRVSPKWELSDEDRLQTLMNSAASYFGGFGLDVFGKNTFGQLLKQAEIDVIGISFGVANKREVYAIDVAFHENGLYYGSSSDETTACVIKKCLRAAFCIMGYFETAEGEVIFATPRVTPAVRVKIEMHMMHLNTFFKQEGLGFKARFMANADFNERILQPILMASGGISDTSELFLRSYQLSKIFESKADKLSQLAGVNAEQKTLSEIKIGRLVQLTMGELMESGALSDAELESLCDKEYSHETFGVQFAVLKKLEQGEDASAAARDQNFYRRYYSNLYSCRSAAYLLTNQWFEKSREPFVA